MLMEPFLPGHSGGLKGFVAQTIANEGVRHWVGSERISRIQVVLQKEAGRFAELDAESQLVHGDFNPSNILVHHGKISGILDWEYALVGTPYMDIGNLLRNLDRQYHTAIFAGLTAGGLKLPPDWKERAHLADLTSHLEFLTSNRADAFKQECVFRIENFLSQFENDS